MQVRRYPFVNDDEKLNAIADNTIETNEIEEKIRKINEALDKEIKKEEEKIVQELFEDENIIESVLNDIKDLESELDEETLEETFEIDDFDLSSIVNTRNVPLDDIVLSDDDEALTSLVEFELIKEAE